MIVSTNRRMTQMSGTTYFLSTLLVLRRGITATNTRRLILETRNMSDSRSRRGFAARRRGRECVTAQSPHRAETTAMPHPKTAHPPTTHPVIRTTTNENKSSHFVTEPSDFKWREKLDSPAFVAQVGGSSFGWAAAGKHVLNIGPSSNYRSYLLGSENLTI